MVGADLVCFVAFPPGPSRMRGRPLLLCATLKQESYSFYVSILCLYTSTPLENKNIQSSLMTCISGKVVVLHS